MLPYPIVPILLTFPLLLQGNSTTPDSGAQSGTLVAILVAVCVGVIDQLFKRYSTKTAVAQPAPEPVHPRRKKPDDGDTIEFEDDDAAATIYRILQPQVLEIKADISRMYEKMDELAEEVRTEMKKPIQVEVNLNLKGDK